MPREEFERLLTEFRASQARIDELEKRNKVLETLPERFVGTQRSIF